MKAQMSSSFLVVSLVAAGMLLVTPAAMAQGSEIREYQPIPPSVEAPPEIQELEKMETETPPKPAQPISVDELLELVRKQPDGKAKVEAAKAHAKGAVSDFSLVLNRDNQWKTSVGRAYFYGVLLLPGGDDWYLWPNLEILPMGTQVRKPATSVNFHVPEDGWYVVNVQTTRKYPTMTMWVYDWGWKNMGTLPGGVSTNYPMLLFLSAGWHFAFYTVDSGVAYITQITVSGI